jgi:hypothetical protein
LSDSCERRAAPIILEINDFNDAGNLIKRIYRAEWEEIRRVLETMPLHLKASDQAGKQGRPIFDPVGTNEAIKAALAPRGWQRIPIPTEFDFLGTDVDFGKNGVIVEAQFSNYPFLLNNTIRSELFFKSKIALTGKPTKLVVLITKARLFPASNSTLNYDQADRQLTSLANYKVFDVPIRLVGLTVDPSGIIPAIWTGYTATRYSCTVEIRGPRRFVVSSQRPNGRWVFSLIEET